MKTVYQAFILIWASTLLATPLAPLASAQLYNPSSTTSTSGTSSPSWSQQKAQCNNFCSYLVDGSGKVKGLDGSTGWTTADDQWCADHGSQTNPLIYAKPVDPSAGPAPNESCSVSLRPGDTSCQEAKMRFAHCQFHNGQVEQQCEAYVAAGGAHAGEKTVMFLDMSAAGICGAACVDQALVGPGMIAACHASSMSASGAELIATLAQKSSAVSKLISAGMGGFGFYKNAKSVASTGWGGNSDKAVVQDKASLAKDPSNKTLKAQLKTDKSNAEKDNKSKNRHAACLSMIMYSAMSLARFAAIHSQNSTQQNACQSVIQLASTASTVGAGTMLGQSGSTASGSSAQTGGTGVSLSNGGDSSLRCVESGSTVSSCTGQSASAATDAGVLSSSGLAPQVAPAAQQLAASPLGQQLASGQGDPSQGMMDAAGGAGDAGNAVMTVASALQPHAKEFADGVTASTVGASGGGGGGSSDSSGQPPNPLAALAALLGGKKQQNPMGGTMAFRGLAENHDIWHRNTTKNIFQIVSSRIAKEEMKMR